MARGPKPRPKPSADAVSTLPVPRGMNDAAAREWRHIVAILAQQRVLSELDIAALTVYATSMAAYRQAQAHIDENGTVVIGTTGTPVVNPYMRVQKEAWDRIRPLFAEFGLTPSARARLKLAGPEADKGLSF